MSDRGMMVVGLMAMLGTLTFAPVPEPVRIIGFWLGFGAFAAMLVFPR